MFLLRKLSIQSKLILLVLGATVGSMVIIANIGYTSGRDGLETSVYNQLAGLRETRVDRLKARMRFIREQVNIFSEDRMVVEAMREFLAAYRKLDDTAVKPEWDQKVKDFYQSEFLPELAKKVEGRPQVEAYLPPNPAARYLQYWYLANNPAPYASFKKDALDDAGDGNKYSELHKKYQPLFRRIIKSFNCEDMMLVDADKGDIVYDVEKNTAFGTSLLTGPYAVGHLGEMFRSIRKVKDPNAFQFARYEPYLPILNRPAAFVASPIADGTTIVGILVFQLPIEAINRILIGDIKDWERDGLGKTGEVYAVGDDKRLRTVPRFYTENPEAYLDTLQKNGYSEEQVERIRRAGTPILVQQVHSDPVKKALKGQTGVEIHTDYRGKQALSAYTPFETEGSRWAIVAKMDLAEAFAPIRVFGRQVSIAATVITLVVSLLAILLSYLMVRPIHRLIDGARQVSSGKIDVQVYVGSQDEFKELADSFNEMTRNLKAKSEQVEQKVRENEELLLNILPGAAAARHKLGEQQISESHADVTVLFAEVIGFNEMVEAMTPEGAVGLLNDLIVAFDEAAQRHGVEKVKTVGATYMAACGLSVQRVDHSHRMVEFAQELLQIVRRFNQEREATLGIQISINAGPVLGGVVGRTRFIYDLWGDTVNVARRLQAGGEVNTIRVTQAVHDRLRDLHNFEGPQTIEIPGKGKLAVWTLQIPGASGKPETKRGAKKV